MEKLKLLAKSLKHICGGIHFSKVEDFEPKYLLKDELCKWYVSRISPRL